MDPLDLEIKKRLDKLKEPVPNLPSEDELQLRLRRLKGLPETVEKKYVLLPKPRSATEQVDDLMKQYTEQTHLDDKYSSEKSALSANVSIEELERRLRNLKQTNVENKCSEKQSQGSDTKILLKKIMAEAKLEETTEKAFPRLKLRKYEPKEVANRSESDSEEEFCCMCHHRPTWICITCDKDEFCNKCYKEYHDELGEYHKRKPMKRRKKKSSSSESD